MITVTSAELQKNFGRYRELAHREPLSITNHGRESLVLLSAEDYRRLKELDTREALHTWELPDEDMAALKAAEPHPDCATFDREMDE
ncbi:MAG: type II toxin-antitoxin system Phd/YefM family antitoxin [Pseudomonadota bacterium]